MKKKRLFSGMQPTGNLHIGNYLGAIVNWLNLIDKYECIFSIVDYHAMTVPYEVEQMNFNVLDMATMFLACGLTPDRSTIFLQSDVPEHTELAWILNCVTPINYLERMIQFKEKSEQVEAVSNGLFSYPVLQSADILLYHGESVPVGEDQLQHIELCRDIARKFNQRFGDYFPEPEAVLSPARRVLGLDGKRKMSKSLNNEIALAETPEGTLKLLKRAKTDERRQRLSDPGEPEDCNVFTYHQYFSSDADRADIAERCRSANIGCIECKTKLADNMNHSLAQIRERYADLKSRPQEVQEILKAGAEKVRPIAQNTIAEVKSLMGVGKYND